jgi:glutaredoxin-like YruB-family protein
MKVKIYTTPTCPWCKKTKEFLTQHNIEYEEINVAGNPEAAHEMVQKSGQMGVPVLDIDEEIIVGYDVEKIKKKLRIR